MSAIHDKDYSPSTSELDTALEGAVEALLWTTAHYDESGGDANGYLDETHDITDIESNSLESLRAELVEFISDNSDDLDRISYAQIGHDFILTRNGHGAGFWDRGLGDAGDRLTAACKPYGETALYIGDDGRVWFQ